MQREFEEQLRRTFCSSISDVRIRAVDKIEVDAVLDGKKRTADIFEGIIKNDIFRLYMKTIRFNKTFFKEEEEFSTYEFNRTACPPFTIDKVLLLLHQAGYSVPESLYEVGKENYEVPESVIKKSEWGKAKFFQNLRKMDIQSLGLKLSYKEEREGHFMLCAAVNAPCPVDLGKLKSLDLGILDYKREVGKEKKDAIIRYMNALNTYAMHSGLEIFNIVDYMTLIEAMQERVEGGSFSITIEKARSKYSRLNPDFGGNSYKDYGIELTPLDFAWYVDLFSDSDSERSEFFRYYDSIMKEDETDVTDGYLAVLGLDRSASMEDIEKAYRKKIMHLHPDKIASYDLDPAFIAFANTETAKVNEAYEKLKMLFR